MSVFLTAVFLFFNFISLIDSAAIICPIDCPIANRICVTGAQIFENAPTGSTIWFNAILSNAASLNPSYTFTITQQQITLNSSCGTTQFSPADSTVTINSGSTASTSYSAGAWTTFSGTSCGNDVFMAGLGVASPCELTSNDWQWCFLIQSAPTAQPLNFNFGASVYTNPPALPGNQNTFNVAPTTGACSSGSDAATPRYYTDLTTQLVIGGGTGADEGRDPIGFKRTAATSITPCVCPITTAPTKAPTEAPTRAPTKAPTSKAPTEAPTEAPTRAPTTASPTRAPTSRAPTEAPTEAPTRAPTTASPTRAPTSRAPTEAPTTAPTRAPTPPTEAPTSAPTRAPTSRAPTEAPTTAPTRAPTTGTPTRAPTSRAPTEAPTGAPTRAPTPPTEAPTSAPTRAPTSRAPTEAPTTAPTRAPTPPTEAPTEAPTRAPTSRAPTEAPTEAPTRAPTSRAPTRAPTSRAPTEAPTEAPTRAPTPPTEAPTEAPTRAPTSRAPTNAPTLPPSPPTVRPTRAPTPPTVPPPTNAPTTGAPTAPIDICTRKFTAKFTLTYDAMTYGYVSGTLVYDWENNVLAFYYDNQTYQEIYQFNNEQGVGNVNGQNVYRISPNGTCSPCARYQNNWAFPVFWNISGVANPYPTGVGADGCTNYTVPASNNNFAQFFGLYPNGTLCYIGNQGRLFVLDSVRYCDVYDPGLVTPPAGCACSTPQDIAFSLDRSTSIRTDSTYIYREFLQRFVESYYFDPTSPTISTQMGIVQWGNILNPTDLPFPIGNYGSIPMTMDGNNVRTAVSQVGCVGNPCNFCNGNSNASRCIFPDIYRTCTACGLYGAGKLFTDTANYRKRTASSQVIIVITDGNANTLNSSWDPTGSSLCCGDGDVTTSALVPGKDPNCDDGPWQTYAPLGCFTDINNTKQQVLQMVPGVSIFAIGVGANVNPDTLKVIASSDANVFSSPDWTTFLSQLQNIITLTCVEPDPITSCGTGAAACGFCACGNTQIPDGIIPPNLCEEVRVEQQGQCYSGIPIRLNCTAPPCETPRCIPTMNNGTGGCINEPTVCNQPDICYDPVCIMGNCVPKAICNDTHPSCNITCPPTQPPTPPNPACINSTGGIGCGSNGICDVLTGRCNCTNGFHGIICQFPPGVPECFTDGECDDSTGCTNDTCVLDIVNIAICQYIGIDCNDNDFCTDDFCNASGCQHLATVSCNDNDGCTDDYCNATDGTCYYVDRSVNCDNLTDVCNIAYCDPRAPEDDQCFREGVVCPRDNNCTVAICETNSTTNISGCTNTSLDCFAGLGALIGGLTAGIIAIIIVAALLALCAIAGGGTYAVTTQMAGEHEAEVLNNPLFQGAMTEQSNPLHGC